MRIMNIKPLYKKVALKEFNKESTTSTGLVLMGDIGGDTPEYGVVAIGPEVTLVKVDDRVLIDPTKIRSVSVDTVIVDEDDIMVVLND